jgi:hypothetical protein
MDEHQIEITRWFGWNAQHFTCVVSCALEGALRPPKVRLVRL